MYYFLCKLVKYSTFPIQVPQENLFGDLEEEFAARRMHYSQPVKPRYCQTTQVHGL